MKKAFITGATGFLGLNLIEELSRQDWEIHALHLPGEDLGQLLRFQVQAIAGDILDPGSIKKALPKDVDAVFHLAGDTSTWSKNNARQWKINVDGTINVLNAAVAQNAGRFIYTSSISAFGFHNGPMSEATISTAKESGVNYHLSKFIAEQEIRKKANLIRSVILNPCNVIGPYDRVNWAQTIKAVHQDRVPGYPPGTGTFAHVRDIAAAHIAAAEHENPEIQYVLGGTPAAFEQVFAVIEKILGMPHSGKLISKNKLKAFTYLLQIKSWFDGKEPLITLEKYKRLVGTQLCHDQLAVHDLGLQKAPLEEMFTDSYHWLRQENLLND
ncbi:NAD-dependent epimerase/dehydratase family protein [Desulfatibacillum aliphaticivorans]|uniref:NAD-dependent epimerase/dehydratase family protein n=1 Tax=Desulfatibacillum aliphaticivorans TaxID=218208 RepID=UPI000429ACE3|nr:NAD-dependent epimerase/dehydratase family protein [Desulfatibacillum aliphaticivorans]